MDFSVPVIRGAHWTKTAALGPSGAIYVGVFHDRIVAVSNRHRSQYLF